MTQREDMIDVAARLAEMRDDLMVAVAADRRRSHRRRLRLAGLVLVASLFAGSTAVATTTSFFDAAPGWVKDVFDQLNGRDGSVSIDASRAVRIGEIDDHVAYAAPSSSGGFCLYFAPNPRSGPTGATCTDGEGIGSDEVLIADAIGHDGGFLFGRVGTDVAEKVEIHLPSDGGIVTTPVRTDRFFLVRIPERTMQALVVDGLFDLRRMRDLSATALDAQGAPVARSATPYSQPLQPVDGDGGPSEAPLP
jgi:hypothetical protein